MNYKLCPHVNYYLLPLQINAPQAESSALADEQEDRLAPMDMGMGEASMLGSSHVRDDERQTAPRLQESAGSRASRLARRPCS